MWPNCSKNPLQNPQKSRVKRRKEPKVIKFNEKSVEISPAAARALLAFASEEPSRSNLYGIGINRGNLCASDGHTALRLIPAKPGELETPPLGLEGRIFSRGYVEAQVSHAARCGRGTPIHLAWENAEPGFCPLYKVEPKPGFNGSDGGPGPVGIDPEFLARLVLVSKAMWQPGRDAFGKAFAPPVVALAALRGPLEPLLFECKVPAVGEARVTIMPVRM